ncbi:conserved hypothetical protein [Leishmania major strain Friedlin]|uniref:Uncharacterized protein n=1 Tax=Leishmania major TaxID=5664 RepID=Q4QCP5_LEIMA|nr:conserved hypothetical protein [Leishmania major strain Friedlin]CAG9573224.1 hypothetical_protein_-_conserved [Leishmania major strain Friedlin]CAJ04420.1 conserved hypothetical protein [Leishmania major strain Friedlin]|eukprot:XP_001682903.1 conserved hypothetical protein [Leishmania major strain Friedlin]
MGAANSCTCSETKYRFKDFIVSVYPDNIHGGPDEDALAKLNNYIASNPERIPRVCRKIGKLLLIHLASKKETRVMVSVLMLRSLIEHAARVVDFVPHSVDICALLLSTSIPRYHIGAADVLSTLCYRLSTQPNTDSARRLIADNKDRLVPQLLQMTSDHIASRKCANTVQTRYAAILALGNIANCIHTALAGNAAVIMQAMIVNLILVLRERAHKPLSDASVHLLAKQHNGGADATSVASPILKLPAEAEEQDVTYALACSHGIGATAACTTTAGVAGLLNRVTALLETQNGWGIPHVPSLVFRDIVSAMQRRPQQLGFLVYQCLCDMGQCTSDPSVRIGVLRSLQACVDVLPMTGGRPAVVLDHIVSVMQPPMAGSTTDGAAAGDEDGVDSACLEKDTHDAVVTLTSRLLRSTYLRHNGSQLQSILVSLWHLLEAAQSRGTPHPTLVLRLLVVAAPYLRSVPLVDRRDIRVTDGLECYLNGSGGDVQRHLASRVLAGILAGIPAPTHSAVEGGGGGDKVSVAEVTAAFAAAPSPPTGTGVLFTAEEDVAFAQEWVKRVSKETEGVTPLTVVSVANVLCALMAGYGVSGLPFTLMFLWALQQLCVRVEPASAAARQDDTASASTATVTTMSASRAATSPLTRAWLHMIAALLVCCGRVYAIPKLQAYGQEILEKRVAAGQLASCFEPALRISGHAADVYTVSGLRCHASEKSRPLATDFTEAPVSKLPSFSYVSNIIADADWADVAVVFGASDEEKLHMVIEEVCFQPDSEVSVSLSSLIAARSSSIPAADAMSQRSLHFSLSVQDEAKVSTLRSLRISVVDNSILRAQDSRGAVPLSAAAITTAKKVQEIAEHYNVSAATQVLPPETTAALPPLPMLPLHRDDEDTSGGMSESSEFASEVRGKAMSPPLYVAGCTADSRSRSGAGTESAAFVNPLNVDVGIQAARKAQRALSIRALPAARYVSMV